MVVNIFRNLFLLLSSLSLSACFNFAKQVQINGHTMGTQYHITIVTKKKSPPIDKLKKQIDYLLIAINQQMSTYINNSEINKFNRYKKTTEFPISNEFAYVVEAALDISKQTKGAFDITVSPFIDLWGFGSKTQYATPTKEKIQTLFAYVGFQHLTVKSNPVALQKDNIKVKINLSAIAKGFAVDKISDFLEKQGYQNYLVEIGGEVRSKGDNSSGKKWRIAIEQPKLNKNIVNRIITISDKAVATSGDYRNYFIKDKVRYSHTINPKTGSPVKHKLASVTVINDSAMYADGYATALMVMGEKIGKEFAKKQNIQVNMIIRNSNNSFTTWSNIP